MKKVIQKLNSGVYIVIIILCLILLIPMPNNETLFNFFVPKLTFKFRFGSAEVVASNLITIISLLIAIVSLIRVRGIFTKVNPQWKYLLYFIFFILFITNIRTAIGEKTMAFKSGLQAVEFQADKSEIKYYRDSLGVVHAEGNVTFKNYSSDTILFDAVLFGDNFGLMHGDIISNIHLQAEISSENYPGIKLAPLSSHSVSVKFDKKLKMCSSVVGEYYGKINRIKKIAIYSETGKRTFENF